MRKELAEAKRAGKRQAAPFSKGGRTNRPKRPGRKPGIGSFSYRKPPSPDEVTEPPVDVSMADDNCPGCGGVLEQEGVDVAYVTDIPAMPRPQVTEYRVQVCRCRGCGRRVRGRHAEVGADQYGASAQRVGRRVMAAAHVLHYGVGIPVRWEMLPEAARFGACESGRPHRRHWMASGWRGRLPDGVRDG